MGVPENLKNKTFFKEENFKENRNAVSNEIGLFLHVKSEGPC